MRSTRRARRRAAGVTVALMVSAMISGCSPGPSVSPLEPSVSASVWALGDSQASRWTAPNRGPGWPDRLGPAVFNGAWGSSGSGFIRRGSSSGRSVVEEAVWLLANYPAPQTLLVIAGTNDLVDFHSPAEMMAAVEELEAIAFSAGVTVRYVSVPPFPEGPASASGREAARLGFNALLASASPGRFVNCDPQLQEPGGSSLRSEYRLAATDDLHLGDLGLRELARCAATFGPPLVSPQ